MASETQTAMYGDKKGSERCPDTIREDGKHCGHLTGRSWDTGMATHGGAEVQCCDCGATTEAGFVVNHVPLPEHGPYQSRPERAYTAPKHWTIAL